MARMNISIPDELRARMDEVEIVSWSGVAARAFELEVNKRKRITDMDHAQIVDRLKASYAVTAEADFNTGHEDGVKWAAKEAEADQLMWLSETDDAVDLIFDGKSDGTPFEVRHEHDIFFKDQSRQYARGFVAGAVEVWEKVEDEVRSQSTY
ncbi:hypothetical protein [Roseovarius sp.]|uniref:hypothetical protein n=1 Tax=Roseovarius sp. TaxID=1486281 RepID=UPI003BADB1FC